MLSVLIDAHGDDDDEGVARTLASLVGGAVEGVVREVIVCGSGQCTRTVADQAGCEWVPEGGIGAGIAKARSAWLLLLEPGARLAEGWTDVVMHHVETSAMAACFSRAQGSRSPFLSRLLSRPHALAQGLVITRKQALVLAKKAGTAEALARGLAMKTLRAEIWPVRPGA